MATTIYCAENYGYGRTLHGRKGECGCTYCRAARKFKLINRKRTLRSLRENAYSSREIQEDIQEAMVS
jgi:hypothetical protein